MAKKAPFGTLPLDCICEIFDYLHDFVPLNREIVQTVYARWSSERWYDQYCNILISVDRWCVRIPQLNYDTATDWCAQFMRIKSDYNSYIQLNNMMQRCVGNNSIGITQMFDSLPIELLFVYDAVYATNIGMRYIPDVNLTNAIVTTLCLAHNRIQSAPASLFKLNGSLSLANNELTAIPRGLTMSELSKIDLSNNKITTTFADRSALADLRQCERLIPRKTIYLFANAITYLPNDTMIGGNLTLDFTTEKFHMS